MSHPQQSPSDAITAEVTSWDGVTAGFGGAASWRSSSAAASSATCTATTRPTSSSLPSSVGAPARRGPDRLSPGLPGATRAGGRRIEGPQDVPDVIAMMRLNYERIHARRDGQSGRRGVAAAGRGTRPVLCAAGTGSRPSAVRTRLDWRHGRRPPISCGPPSRRRLPIQGGDGEPPVADQGRAPQARGPG